ncbi:VWA domain-containing protein [Methanococcoides sp. SA1]|nr:VWA domain-containing protein [Methanococcoides sp. SA1]
MSEIITFGVPLWLSVGAVVIALLIFLYKKMGQRRERALQVFAAPHLLGKLCSNVSSQRRLLKRILLLAAIACCFTALARPQYGYKWIDVKRKGIDILFAVDTSKSMLAEDVSPNRLKRARFAILDFVGQLQGDRVGIMPFAGAAFLMCPMTIDYSAFESSLGAIDTTIIPKGGTDLAAVITEAEKVLSNEANHKILVLITDGENLQGDVLKAATAAAEKGMTIYSVGVGSREGELIPFHQNGKSGFVKDEAGNFITSRLDENMLTQIAELTGGLYVPLGSSGEGLQAIYQKKLSLIPKEDVAEKRHKVALERFVWPLGAAIVLLMFEFLLGGRKSTHGLRMPFIKTAGRRNKQKMTAVLLLLFGLGTLVPAQQAEASKGEDAYGRGDFITASTFYDELLQESPNDARLHYNYGTAAYKNNMFEDAAKAFGEALKSDDLGLQKEAYYNRGNALFQRGNETLQTDPQHTIKMWTEAVASFDGALQLDSKNDDAHYNLELVKKSLEELKKQQEQQDQEKKYQDQKSDDGKEQQDDQGQQKESGDQGEETKEEQSSDNDSGQQESPEDGQEQQKDSQSEKKGEEAEQDQKDASAGKEESGEDEQDAEEQEAAREKEQQEAAARDLERRSQGRMTEDEAKQLLNSLKDETGELNFVPAAISSGARDQKISKDW